MGIELRDMIVVVPGIMGSNLSRHGKPAWATSLGRLTLIAAGLGGSLKALALGNDSPDEVDIGDGVEATGLIRTPCILPRLIKADGYGHTVSRLRDYFETEEDPSGGNFHEFPYDWRRDNRYSAKRLKSFVTTRLAAWRKQAGPDAKIVFIAHSMGGLVARYYLEVLEGWRDCKALITLGTPFRGSPQSLDFLANGYRIGGIIDLSTVMQSFTSVYQLLPTYPMVTADGTQRRVIETTGIPNIDYAKVKAAKAFHDELRDAVARNGSNAEYHNDGYRLIPMIGRDQPTLQSASLTGARLAANSIAPTGLPEHLWGGDGTVPRLSASPSDLDGMARESFVAERHASLHVHEYILLDIIGKVEQMQAPGTEAFLGGRIGGERPSLSLSVEDLFDSESEVTAQVAALHGSLAKSPKAIIQRTDGTKQSEVLGVRIGDQEWSYSMGVLPDGEYRICVSDTEGHAFPIKDLFEVANTGEAQ